MSKIFQLFINRSANVERNIFSTQTLMHSENSFEDWVVNLQKKLKMNKQEVLDLLISC